MSDESQHPASVPPPYEAAPQAPPPPQQPNSGTGRTLAIVGGAVALAALVVLGSWALLDWWDNRAATSVTVQDDGANDAGGDEDAVQQNRQDQRDDASPLGKVFSPKGGGFSAAFPKKPVRSVLRVPVGNTTVKAIMYAAETANSAYIVGITDVANQKVSLEGAAKGAAAGANAELVETEPTPHQGYDGITYVAKADGAQTFFIKGLIVATPQRMFQVNVVAPKMPERDFRLMVESFTIKGNAN